MVLSNSTKSNQAAFTDGTLELESGLKIDYVAPAHAVSLKESSSTENSMGFVLRKRSFMDGSDPWEDWEGVFEMCYALDHAVRFETDTLVKGCKVLEIGFCTGLPSVFALKNGAKHITLHSNVIFAVEIFNNEKNRFEEVHDFIDYALTNDGVCLLESRMFYMNCESSLQDFLDLVKTKGKFDVYTRWSTPKSEIIQRRVIQLTRAIR
ncbi:hypothetical protein X798_01325 [Onchocerca flexuosa]|uniref:Uncharacterized protein n=1 Tax=Onchocerca flexuosa TaxID=387005 RepID=A0A238C1V6_9BILA|nr:hypothetical protein X798_01325 [Onchocerca flexuosa]